jgi:hypothetical protein
MQTAYSSISTEKKHVCLTLTIFISNKYDSLFQTVSFINKIIRSVNMKIFAILLLIATTAFTFSFAAEEDKKGRSQIRSLNKTNLTFLNRAWNRDRY